MLFKQLSFFLIWIFLSCLSLSVYSETTIDLSGLSHLELDDHLQYLEDVERAETLNDIRGMPESVWQSLPDNGANFGFSASAFWFRLSLENRSIASLERYLVVDYPLLDSIDVFLLSSQASPEYRSSGDRWPFAQRGFDYRGFVFPIRMEAGEKRELLVRVETTGSLQAPMKLMSPESFYEKQQYYMGFLGFMAGTILVMTLYSAFLFVSVREWSYGYYAIFALCALGFTLSIEGLAYQYLWSESPGWHHYSVLFFNGLGSAALCLFTLSYFRLRPGSMVYRISLVTTGITGSSVLLNFVLSYHSAAILQSSISVVLVVGMLSVNVLVWREQPRRAKFYLFAWLAFIAGVILKVGSKSGWLPSTFLYEYASILGTLVSIVTLSIAVAHNLRVERQQKAQAQKQGVESLRKYFSLYKNALEGIFVMNRRGKLLSANPAMLSLLGLNSFEEPYSHPFAEGGVILHEDEMQKLIDVLLEDGEVRHYETRLYTKDGKGFWVAMTARLSEDSQHGAERIEATVINVDERKAFEEELQYLAEHDSLTGLQNRRAFEARARLVLEEVEQKHLIASLMYLDLDQFKLVNDLCGHSAGDKLLKALSLRMQHTLKALGEHATLARLGGDEFAVLICGQNHDAVMAIAEELRSAVENFVFVWDGTRYPIGVSIGLVPIDASLRSLESLLSMADRACYLAKEHGRNRVYVLQESDKDIQLRQRELEWLSLLKDALANDHFSLVVQAIQSNAKGADEGYRYEVLLRLQKDGELISPFTFLPIAERYNLMSAIDRWVVEHFLKFLHDEPGHYANLASASINLCTQSLGDEKFAEDVEVLFERYKIDPRKICFEITETMAITHLDQTREFIRKFRGLGCRFALDDFGTGFSSYGYLRELMIDFIKIDGVFVKHMTNNEVDQSIVRSVTEVAHSMGIECIAEFVENEQIQQRLVELGVDYSQGYHIARPELIDGYASSSEQARINERH